MARYQRKVALSETDATGYLYFTNLLKFATEAFESLLEEREFSLAGAIADGDYLFPIVDAKASYFHPLKLSDRFTIEIEIERIGNTSIEVSALFEKEGVVVGKTKIIHVLVSKTTGKSLSVPEPLRQQLCPQHKGS